MSVPPLFTMPNNTLFSLGLPSAENTFYQLPPDELIRQCVERNEGVLNDTDIPVIDTGRFTGSSFKECFIVKDSNTETSVDRNDLKHPIEEKYFNLLYGKMIDHLGKKEIWIRDSYINTDSGYRLNIRNINEDPSGNLFVYYMFLSPAQKELENFDPDWYIIHTPAFFANPETDGTKQKIFTIINLTKKVILIAGSAYTPEIKKEIFSILSVDY